MLTQQSLQIVTGRRGTYEITRKLREAVGAAGVQTGLFHLFIKHTSASLIICENADPTVREDLENFFAEIAPDGDSTYRHSLEGPDDMPAHIRTILTQNSLTIPISSGELALGTWQGVFVYEHRYHAGARDILITIQE